MIKEILNKNKDSFCEVVEINNSSMHLLDLSNNNAFLNDFDTDKPDVFQDFINKTLEKSNKDIAFGGYLEDRFIYKRSSHFGDDENARTIHLGIDIWMKENTAILAPLKSKVHSFNYNDNYGDYGGTIILEHNLNGKTFYTLYGHLSKDSLNINKGQHIKCGQKFAELGNTNENGNWPPHLHFQIIENIGDYKGDYPGVCNKSDLDFYKQNCPDPNLILNY